jgi:hypothetical protein
MRSSRTRSIRTALAVVVGLVATIAGPLVAAGDEHDPALEADIAAAIAHVQEEHDRYEVSAEDVAELVVTNAYRSQHNGVAHVYLRQAVDGTPVSGANFSASVREAEVLFGASRLVADVREHASGVLRLDAVAARRAAVRGLRVTEALLPGPAAQLVYHPGADGRLRLAWLVDVQLVTGAAWWVAAIDAETGALLDVDDLVVREDLGSVAGAIARPGAGASAAVTSAAAAGTSAAGTSAAGTSRDGAAALDADGASYRVYAYPLESPNDGERSLVVNPADPVASPFGWHDTDGEPGPEFTITRGNNVHAYTDTLNQGAPDPLPEPDGGSNLVFDFDLNTLLPPTVWREAAVTNLFYWNNLIHDVFYHYGFDEQAGNFQVNNYGRGGKGGDDVRAEAQDGGGVMNANFATPVDGQRPRMQMYLWAPLGALSPEIRDGDLDAGVIVHEYAHGISNRLTSGPDTVGCLNNQEQMGEGWSDWLALAMLVREGETGAQPRGIGTYVLYENDRTANGIRPTPYSTDMTVNPATYNTIRTAAVPHGVGYVWATMLWEVYWALVEEYGFNPDVTGDWRSGGNNLAIQLVMDGMKFQACRPGFVDGRDAILAAERALTDGGNACILWRAFAKRGLGLSAEQGSFASRSDNSEAFDVPEACSG